MISLKKVFHVHAWQDKGEHFAILPKMNLKPDAQLGMIGKVEACDCGAKKFTHPGLRSVDVEEK